MKFSAFIALALVLATVPGADRRTECDGYLNGSTVIDRRYMGRCDGYQVTATSYSWREPQHRHYGRLNALGSRLDDAQIAADWHFYPPGTVMWIEGLGPRTVTDRGGAVRGPRHIDIHFSSLAAMRAWGTRHVRIHILRKT